MSNAEETTRVLLVGDLILDEPDPHAYFEPSHDILRRGDVVVGQVEVPHTARGVDQSTDVPASAARPEHLSALAEAGFNVATLAGNHICDQGAPGVEDTVAHLQQLGIRTTGAGKNLAQARSPALLERNGLKFGILSYNCVGPREAWATSSKAGCAYVHVLTHYELDHASPGGPATVYTFAAPASLEAMQADIESLRSNVDILIVAFHKGIGHVPAQLAMYERPVAHAAVDAGADIVVGHHAHIMRGIEVYRGKPIYHGLGNFVTVTHALSMENNDNAERRAWARRRRELYGFEPDPEMPAYPFHPESRNTIIAHCEVDRHGIQASGFIPCYIDKAARPQPLAREQGGAAVADYVAHITRAAGLPTTFEWRGDVVTVRAAEAQRGR